MTIIIILAVIAVAFFLYKESKKDKKGDMGIPIAAYFPCVIEGTIDAPPMADRVTALAIEAQSKGITITGDYATDVAKQGGEMMLLGSYRFQLDDKGGVTGDSWMKLFNDDKYPITGGMAGDGTLGMDANFGGAIVNIRGRVVDGKLQGGRAYKSWLPHIGGILKGTWRAV